MGKILNRYEYLRGSKYIINEAFSNDVNWGDSWVGRMINSISRKVKISSNLRKIDDISKKVASLFDELVEGGKTLCDSDVKSFIQTKFLLDTLMEMISNKSDVDSIIHHVDNLKLQVGGYNLDNKEMLIDKLEEFKQYLKTLKDSDTKEESIEDLSSDTSSKDGSVDEEKYYKISVSLLQSILNINTVIKNNSVRFKTIEYGTEFNSKTQFNIEKYNELKVKFEKSKNNINILQQLVQMTEDGLDVYKNRKDKSNINLFTQYFNKYSALLINLKKNNSNNDNEQNDSKDKEGNNNVDVDKTQLTSKAGTPVKKQQYVTEEVDSNLDNKELHAKNAWNKLVKSFNQSGITKHLKEIEDLLNVKLSDGKDKFKDAKNKILSITNQLSKNKVDVIEFDDLIKESIYDNDIPKSISLISRVILSFKGDIGLLGSYGSATNPLKLFISSYDSIIKMGSMSKDKILYKVGDIVKYNLKDGSVGVKKITKINKDVFYFKSKGGEELSSKVSNIIGKAENESYLYTFDYFKVVNESSTINYEDIQDKFDEIFTDDVKNMFKIDNELKDKIISMGKESDKFVITNYDPIIEIVRMFNRAWRLHTPGRIPSGRSGGKVSSSVFAEYENLGSSDGDPDSPGAGPYRNVKLYEKWQESILDILSQTKYRTTIFSDDAVFYFKYNDSEKISVESIKKRGNDIEITPKPLGKVLLRFFNSLLADSQMYKNSGAMYKFFEDYFDLKSDEFKKSPIYLPGDKKRVQESASGIKSFKLKFYSSSIISEELDNQSNLLKYLRDNKSNGMILRLNTKDGQKLLYLIGGDKRNKNIFYFYMLNTFYFDTGRGEIEVSSASYRKPTFINIVSIDIESNKIENNSILKISKSVLNLLTKEETVDVEDVELNIKNYEVLCKSEEKEIYLDSKLPRIKDITSKTKKIFPDIV